MLIPFAGIAFFKPENFKKVCFKLKSFCSILKIFLFDPFPKHTTVCSHCSANYQYSM